MFRADVVLSDYPYTAPLKARDELAGFGLRFHQVTPVFESFGDMIADQRYDVCELAIGAFLQARDEGRPLWLLPVVLAGGHQHKNLYPTPARKVGSPGELSGGRVGVRAYSQTTALWVRAWMAEEYGADLDSITWVVTERSHAPGFTDPDNVELIDGSLVDALTSGDVDAAMLGARWRPDGVGPLVADWAERDASWYAGHGFVPVNHLVSVSGAFLERHPDAVRAIYRELAAGVDATRAEREAAAPAGRPPAIRRGVTQVRAAVELAAKYAYDQGMISRPADDVDALFAFGSELD
jgi:4,5-dihydroxyphthalate decarboxylase